MKFDFKFGLFIIIMLLIIFACFNILHHKIDSVDTQHVNKINNLIERIDSLKNELNFHKMHKDTITLNIINYEN